MPSRVPQFVVRGAAVVLSLGLSTGALSVAHGAPNTGAGTPHHVAAAPTTSTTAAPVPVEVPVTTPPTTAQPPKPVATTSPTTVRRPTATTAPKPAARVSSASPAAAPTPEARGEQALAQINYPWQQLGYTISFEPAHPSYLGLTESDTRTIHIYVRANESLDTLERTIGHEMGHALDFSHTTDAERSQYIAIRGINATLDDWYSCNGCTDYTTAAGDWAETFQYWLFGPGQYWSQMGPPPSPDELAQLSTIFSL